MYNGRDRIIYRGETYVPEREAARMISVTIMRLRRSAVLGIELGKVKLYGHPYYSLTEIEKLQAALAGYILRSAMRKPPQSVSDREKRGETIICGLVCYPRKQRRKK